MALSAKAKKSSGGGQASTTSAAIDAIYNALAGNLSSGVHTQAEDFGRATQLVGSSYDQLTQALKAGASATDGGLGGRFNALGIGAATDAATQGIRNQFSQGLISAARRKASAVGNMERQGAEYQQIGNMGVNNARIMGAQARTDAVTAIEKAVADMETAKATAQGQVDLARVQGETQLAQMKWEHEQAAQKAAATGDPLEALKAEYLGLQIEQKDKQIGLMGQDKPGKAPTKYQGGYDAYLLDSHASPAFKNRADEIIARAYADATDPINVAKGITDPYTFAMDAVSQYHGGANLDRLRRAVQIAFGKV